MHMPCVPVMLTVLQVGMFPDVCEALSLGHLSRGDATSAMVASEWYMRNQHFPGWGRPYEFASELFHKVRSAGQVDGAQSTAAQDRVPLSSDTASAHGS